jgi:ubiquinone/menaquinone biosynthesis C-methylase UbiE
VLDIGSGPGLLAGELAAAVGPTGRVCGVDPSADMLALARARDLGTGCAPVEYLAAGAQRLPYPDDTFNLAVSTKVMEYVPDVPAALAKAYRVLRPGGRLLLLGTDRDSIVRHCAARCVRPRLSPILVRGASVRSRGHAPVSDVLVLPAAGCPRGRTRPAWRQ